MSQRTTILFSAALSLAGAVALATLADAQNGVPPAATPALTPTAAPAAAPGADPVSVWSIQDENASISSAALTDRYYVNGLRIGWTSGTDGVPDFLASAGRVLWGNGQQRISFSLSQQIYTPADASAYKPPVGDEPYAADLLANGAIISDAPDSRSLLGVALGVLGPWALGEQVQNGFHDIIGQGHNNGWHYQLHNEPAYEIVSNRTWRLPIAGFGGVNTDVLPEIEAGLGNLRIYAQAGALFRIGQGLDSDYGPQRVRPGITGADTFVRTRDFAWYIFAGGDVQGVAHDITLDGNTYESSPSVKLKPVIGEFEGGLALMAFGAKLTYTQFVDTQSFQHQKGGPHQFGDLALSVRF